MSASGNTDAPGKETDFYELNHIASKSKEDFIREFEKYSEQNAKAFLIRVLTAIKNSIIDGNIDNLKCLSFIFDNISCTKNYLPLLKEVFNEDAINPLINSNVIILACKHNDAVVLQHLFSNNGMILKQLYSCTGTNILPDNQDEMGNNAFYYAMRSGNVELLYTLVGWPNNYFDTHVDDLDRLISTTYEELKIKNVPLTDEIEFWVENKLIHLRFFSNSPVKDQVTDLDNIKQRVDFVLTDIDHLNAEYLNMDVDERFLFIAKFIAQNIHILKRKLKATYDRLPWEEIEFCLICFIFLYIEKREINLFCNTFLSKEQLLRHLQNFAKELKEVKKYIIGVSLGNLLKYPQVNRFQLVTDIINKNPQFKELFESYEKIRDVCSMLKINTYLNLAAKANPEERNGQLLIIRALQVTGEHLKNTLESPKMSSVTSDYILLAVAKNTRKIISDLRDSLSHAESLFKRTEIEEKSDASFFKGIQNDIKRIGEVIFDILYSRKMDVLKYLYEKIVASENLDEIKEVVRVTDNSNFENTSQEKFKTNEYQKLKKLIEKLSEKIPDRTFIEDELFNRMNNIMDLTENKSKNIESNYHYGFRNLKIFSVNMNWGVNHNNFFSLKFQAEQDLENAFPVIDFQYLKEIAELAEKLLSIVILRIYSNNLEEPTVVIDEIMRLAYGIFHMAAFRSNDIQWIEELREKLFQKRARTHNQRNLCDPTKEKYNTILESRQLELKNILNYNSLSSGSTKRISVYKNDEKLQAVVEMLTLDIMSILAYFHKLENNDLFLDDNYPLLTGKCLRNYLAHDNVLVSLLANPSKVVLLNAIKLTGNALMTNSRKFGKLASENPSKLRQKYNKNLQIISNQKRMFVAVEKGNKEELYECFKAGSDVKARNITSWTSFHFAAKGLDVKILKFLHDQNPILDVKDINGQNPLHIAAAYGRTDNAKYLIEEGNICVSDKDIYQNSPIHIAAMKGHKKTFEFLLKNASALEFMYDDLPLEFAIQNNHIEIVKFLLEENKNCYKHKNRRGFVPLIEAAEGGHLEIVELLLQKNVDLNARNNIRSTALHEAALNGHRGVVNVLVLEGADVDAQDVEDYTPLHHAARYSHEEIVGILLDGRAKANVYHKIDRHTPLHLACQFGSLPIVKNLLKYRANVNAELVAKTTPIHAAVISGHLDVVAFLCEHGANIKAERGYTPLFAAAYSGQDKIAEFLIENGAKIDVKAFDDLTPLLAAAMKNCKHTVKLLLEKKADIDARDIKGNSVLHVAVTNAEIDLIDFLIQNKAGVDNKNIVGCTPLHMAALRGRKDIVSILVKNNAQINETSYWNSTPLHLAIDNGHLEVAHFLIENDAVINVERNCLVSTTLSSASIRNHMQIVDILISKGVDVNEKNGEALFLTVEAGYSDMVQNLIEKNARIDFKYFNDNTLLHSAARHGHKKIVNILIAKRADIDAVNCQSKTPLYFAAQEGHADIVEILIDKKANVNIRSHKGLSPLAIATQAGHNDVVKIMLTNAANCDMNDYKYKTVLGRAVALGHSEVVKTILQSKKIDVNIADNADYPVLHLAVQVSKLELVKLLVNYGFDINFKNSSGSKPIHIAAKKGWKEAVQFFLNKGCNISDLGECNQTLLHYAVSGNNLATIQYLIDENADVNAIDNNGLSSLHIAASRGYKNVMEILLKNGSAYNAIDMSDRKPLNMANDSTVRRFLTAIRSFFQAAKNNNDREVERCINAGVFVDVKNRKSEAPLHYAAWKGYDKIVDKILEYNANPNVINKTGFTPLHYAVKFSHRQIVKALLSHGAVFNKHSQSGKTPRDLSTDEDISNLLNFVSELFQDIKNRDAIFMSKLNSIEEINTMRAVMCACNEDKETLTLLAMKENLRETDQLKEVMQQGVSDMINKAAMHDDNGDYQQALHIYQSVLVKRKEILGPNNPSTLKIEFHIALTLYKEGRYRKALEMLEDIFPKQKAIFRSDDNFDVAETGCLIAVILNDLERCEEAFNILQGIYHNVKKKFGLNHERTLLVMDQFAGLLIKQEKYEEALDISKILFEKGKEVFGSDNRYVLNAQCHLALVLNRRGKREEALKNFKEVLNKQIDLLGINHADTLRTKGNIAEVFFDQGKYQKALEAYQEVLKVQKSVFGSNHLLTLKTQYHLLKTFFHQGKYIAVLRLYNEIVYQGKDKLGESHLADILCKVEESKLKIKLHGIGREEILQQVKKDIKRASKNGDIMSVRRLLNGGVDVNDKDEDGRTPLHYAASEGHINVASILLKNGANVSQKDNDGLTPLDYAKNNGHIDVVNVLMEQCINGSKKIKTTME